MLNPAVDDTAAGALLAGAWAAGLAGVAVAALSAGIAWAGLRLAAGRPQLLVAAVLGGTLLRLALVGAASVALLLLSRIHAGGYITGLVGAYLVFLAIEIVFVARRGGGGGRGRRAC